MQQSFTFNSTPRFSDIVFAGAKCDFCWLVSTSWQITLRLFPAVLRSAAGEATSGKSRALSEGKTSANMTYNTTEPQVHKGNTCQQKQLYANMMYNTVETKVQRGREVTKTLRTVKKIHDTSCNT